MYPAISDRNGWRVVLETRVDVLKALEEARQAKQIGKSIEAKVTIKAGASTFGDLKDDKKSLKELFNVAQVELLEDKALGNDVVVEVSPADGDKCDRCWNYMLDVSAYGAWPRVCGRCQSALAEMGIEPPAFEEAHA